MEYRAGAVFHGYMEANYTEDHLGNEGQVGPKPPKLEFSVLQNTINLEEVLSSDAAKRPSALQFRMPGEEFVNQNPGDLAASYLLDKLYRSHVTIEEYKETMPNLLKMAEKPGGGFDKDFISVTVRQFDRIWARMTDGCQRRRENASAGRSKNTSGLTP